MRSPSRLPAHRHACPWPAPSPAGGAAARPVRRGFTLVELMVTLAVLVVLMAVALPSLTEFAAGNQLSTARSAFSSSVALARSEAVKRGQPVLLQAATVGAAGNEFGGGWEIVVDDNANGAADSTEPRVRRFAALSSGVTLGGTGPLVFSATGHLVAASDQVFTACRVIGSRLGYTITVTPSGVADVAAVATC